MTGLYDVGLGTGRHTHTFRKAKIVVIPKLGCPQLALCSYRRILLLDALRKDLGRTVATRLAEEAINGETILSNYICVVPRRAVMDLRIHLRRRRQPQSLRSISKEPLMQTGTQDGGKAMADEFVEMGQKIDGRRKASIHAEGTTTALKEVVACITPKELEIDQGKPALLHIKGRRRVAGNPFVTVKGLDMYKATLEKTSMRWLGLRLDPELLFDKYIGPV
ncbi:RNA-directed DNA polymerase from mobile element jockey [Ceratocystis lukuohia]|uniref:RNA-directed DNA polymerase from mobile element jockey n=1 Tax=Ceratocystis lukuohia TaxID=2019550 RepID=A0ABR4MJZ1_9PEZI